MKEENRPKVAFAVRPALCIGVSERRFSNKSTALVSSRSANLESLPLGFLAVSENVRKAVSFTPYVGDAVPFFHINRALDALFLLVLLFVNSIFAMSAIYVAVSCYFLCCYLWRVSKFVRV